MKKNRMISLITLGFWGALISCQDNKIVLDNDNPNLKNSDIISKIKREGKYNFLPNDKNSRLHVGGAGSDANGLDYRFYGVNWQVCCNQGNRTSFVQLRNTNYYSPLNILTVYVAVQKNMILSSYSLPIGTLTLDFDFGSNYGFKVYRWSLSLAPSQTVVASFSTSWNTNIYYDSDTEGEMGLYLPTYGFTSFCDGTLLNLIRNKYGTCANYPDSPYPGCQ
ncbi:hypothetical protein VB264_20145 [Arcicella aquatica]|uniref:Lipoprotein n=1 Tax=Arcicella aquatica TaxID=217141 RepID=A0ABU5QTE7_9BACT|nr:hypothetical protein [Arcicella aquatica]MEA5260120.1 hypothetical protein [Arcicella aquatica]